MENQNFNNFQPIQPDHPKNERSVLVKTAAAVVLIAVIFTLGYESGRRGFVYEPKEFKIINQNQQPKVVDYQLLWDTLKIVQNKFIDKTPTPDKVLYGAVKGAVSAFGDPYTSFFEPQELENFKIDLSGSFEGIGAEIGKRDGSLVIVSPLDDSPAQRGGLLAKDVILEVNGEAATDWSVEEAVSKIRGKKGTKVTLTIFREGRLQPFEVTIVRDKIEIKSVRWEYKSVKAGGQEKTVAIIRVTRFGEDTVGLFEKAVNEILTRKVDGVVLDLRNNPGGFLQTAVDLASNWLSLGTVVVTEERSQTEPVVYKAVGSARLSSIKTVVLINGGSASASEILAGALQDYKVAKLIGEKSFGKGSVQELIDVRDNAAVKVTVARWVTPSGKNLDKEGLHPDIEIKLTEDDLKNNKDPQMDKALEELSH